MNQPQPSQAEPSQLEPSQSETSQPGTLEAGEESSQQDSPLPPKTSSGPAYSEEPEGSAEVAVETAVDEEPLEEQLAALEAVLMVVEEPVTAVELAAALKLPEHQVVRLLDALRLDAEGLSPEGERVGRQRGYELREVAGGYRYYSRLRFGDEVAAFMLGGQTAKLSQAALETLAIIAYRQPVARSQVAAIRGVNVDGVVRTLVHRGLVDTAGTDPVTGATLYTTTNAFLEKLGVDSVDDLPQLSPHLPGVEAAADYEAEEAADLDTGTGAEPGSDDVR